MTERDTIILKGRVGTDPTTFSQTENRGPYVRFRMVVPRSRRKDNGQWEELESRWYTIRMWGTLANNVSMSIRKGQPIVVIGRPTAQAWQDRDGNLRSEIAINASVVGHDLNLGVSVFRKFAKIGENGEIEEPETFQNNLLGTSKPEEAAFFAEDTLLHSESKQRSENLVETEMEFDPAESSNNSNELVDESTKAVKFQRKVA